MFQKRVFSYSADGEVRCNDPSCNVSQCGQCSIEANRRKKNAAKSARQNEAQKRKREEDDKLVAETTRQIAAGKTFTFTFDRAESDFGDAPTALSDHVIENMEKMEKSFTSDDDRKNKAPIDITSDDDPKVDSKKARQDRDNHTTWNHQTRTMFLKCVAKFNPFSAAVKKDAWAKISSEMGKSTADMIDKEKGTDYRVRTDGHGLQVYYDRRRADMDKKLKKEGSTSGHGGFTRNKDEIEEHNFLQSCRNLEDDAARVKTAKREHNKLLDDLKNNEVNDAIIRAAQDDEVVQVKLLKVLQARVRQAKLEGKIWEGNESNKGMKYTFPSKALKDIEDLDKLKKKMDPDGLASSDVEPVVRTGGSLANAISSLSSKMPDMASYKPVDPAEFARSFFATKQQMTRTLKQKLDEVDEQRDAGVINDQEHAEFTKKVKEAHFSQL